MTEEGLKAPFRKACTENGLRQRIEKRLMFATHRKVVREELEKTIAERENSYPKIYESKSHEWCLGFMAGKQFVLKALSNPLKKGSNPKTKIPKFGLKEANQPTGKFINLDSEEKIKD